MSCVVALGAERINELLTIRILGRLHRHTGRFDMETSLQHRVRERAYELWNAGGRIHGQAEQHWLAAERGILAKMVAEIPASQPIAAVKLVRQRRPLTNVQPKPKKTATAI